MPRNPKLSDIDNKMLAESGFDPMLAEVVEDFDERLKGEQELRESMKALGFRDMKISELEKVIDLAKSVKTGTIFTVKTAAYGIIPLMVTPYKAIVNPQIYIRSLESTVIRVQETLDSKLQSLTFKEIFALLVNKLTRLFKKGSQNGK